MEKVIEGREKTKYIKERKPSAKGAEGKKLSEMPIMHPPANTIIKSSKPCVILPERLILPCLVDENI
ncbi:MAG: hypothetical protein N0E48_23610 [Candidatus Thiodiazotropha endolucinida]|nr:hypothetical protein [Candidatus Thiodiazotropha taylori]MCW4346318.1 hypothetical protein [Candidatus Thiodiazotropha endolucinida]